MPPFLWGGVRMDANYSRFHSGVIVEDDTILFLCCFLARSLRDAALS